MKLTKKILSIFLSILTMLSILSVATPAMAAEYIENQETAAYSNGGISTQALDIFVPVIDSITGNPTSWTKNSVTLTVNATDYGSAGLAAKAYSFDGGNTWQASKSKTFDKNQTVLLMISLTNSLSKLRLVQEHLLIQLRKNINTILPVMY